MARFVILLFACLLSLPLSAQADDAEQMKHYADEYGRCEDARGRLRLANDFFAYLRRIEYIEDSIAFPAGSHIDSVDVNVYYYIAEWYYGSGDYQSAINNCSRATQCMGVVDDASKSDVYALLGAAHFRMGAFDKAADALHQCYEIDKAAGDFDRMSSTLNGIASVFVGAGKPQEAEKYILEAIAANSLTENLARRAVLYGTAAEVYQKMDDQEQSLNYASKALDTERLLGDSARIAVRLSQLAGAQLGAAKIADARSSLEEAIPLLLGSGNLHSWGICQNQMGDILASEGKNDEAAMYYREAAMLFLKQGDGYNELHAREGLYKVTRASLPNEAMMHLERANQLKDSIYQHETSEALGKYNALYYNDILQLEKERAEHRSRIILTAVVVSVVMVLALVGLLIMLTYRRHRQKMEGYEQHISTMKDQSEQLKRQYQNMVADTMQPTVDLTDDDREFLSQLENVVTVSAEKGVTDVDSIARQMHVNTVTLRRRLSQTLSVTPHAYFLKVRMEKAKNLLQNYRDLTIAEVAERCGYWQLPNFTRAFTRYYGVKPSELRTQKSDTDGQAEQETVRNVLKASNFPPPPPMATLRIAEAAEQATKRLKNRASQPPQPQPNHHPTQTNPSSD